MTRPYGPDPYQRGSALSRSFLPLALITLGVVVLLSNLVSNVVPDRGRGGLIVLGLGAAFAVGRLTTGRYGYAVPAGLLIGLGLHIVVQSLDVARGQNGGGLFFVMMGVGFLLVYAIGLRPIAVWPLFLGVILMGLGAVLLGVASLGPLASLNWIAAYWPAALVILGVWLLFREAVPAPLRRPLATIGGIALLAYGVLAAASLAATGSLAQSNAASSPFAETVELNQPITAGHTFSVNNTSGPTTVRSGSGTDVHVVATRHTGFGGQARDVQLTPEANGDVTLSSASGNGSGFPFDRDSGWVEYTIDVPAGVGVRAQSTSGPLTIDGVTGPVQAQATSGPIRGTQLPHLVKAQTSSGSISLDGVFSEAATVNSSSGTVNLKLLPGSAVTLDVHTNSGSVQPEGGLVLNGGVTRRDTLTGAIGTPAADATLKVQTSSGSVVISE
jgi:hypothetical protein